MRRLPSDAGVSMTRWSWRYYRWLSWVFSAMGVLMVLWATFILLFTLSVRPTDWMMIKFLLLFLAGGCMAGYAGIRVYKWMGRREPPAAGAPE